MSSRSLHPTLPSVVDPHTPETFQTNRVRRAVPRRSRWQHEWAIADRRSDRDSDRDYLTRDTIELIAPYRTVSPDDFRRPLKCRYNDWACLVTGAAEWLPPTGGATAGLTAGANAPFFLSGGGQIPAIH